MNEVDLNDALDDLIGGEPITPTPLRRPVPSAFVEPETFWDNCPKCGGTGSWRGRGTCFACKGKGGKSFKTSAADRAANREKAHVRKERDRAAWLAEHKAEVEWLAGACERQTARIEKGEAPWQFVLDLNEKLTQWSSLTDGQLEAVRKCMARDAERQAERAKQNAERAANAPAVDAAKIEQAFAIARTKAERPNAMGVWVKPLKLRKPGPVDETGKEIDKSLGTDLILSEGSTGSQWQGMLFVKTAEGKKLGSIKSGKFIRRFECTDAEQDAVIEVINDPHQAAVAFGKAWSICCVCGQTLTNDGSIERGIGPICADKFGW